MDQSKSNEESQNDKSEIPLPTRKFTTEFVVGIFTLLGMAALAYQAVGLGGMQFGSGNRYQITAEFDNVSGLKSGAAVEIAGVPIGEVSAIDLKDPEALITLQIHNSIQIRDDDIAAVRTKGIIGDKYVKISRGASDITLEPGETIIETESVVDIEDIIGKLVHNFSSDDDE